MHLAIKNMYVRINAIMFTVYTRPINLPVKKAALEMAEVVVVDPVHV